MKRIKLQYPDGKYTYGMLDKKANGFRLGGVLYTVEDLLQTGATAIANNPETLRQLNDMGMKARPTPRSNITSVNIPPDVHERFRAAAEKEKTSMSNIIVNLIIKWLEERDL